MTRREILTRGGLAAALAPIAVAAALAPKPVPKPLLQAEPCGTLSAADWNALVDAVVELQGRA